MTSPSSNGRITILETVLLFVAMLVPLWVPGPFATFDGPQHAFAGYVLNHHDDAGTAFSRYLEIRVPLSALFAPLSIAFFEKFVSIRMAVKCTLTVIFLLQAGGYLRLLSAVGARRSIFRWFTPVIPYTFVFYMGFHNYSAALGFSFFALAQIASLESVREQSSKQRRRRWVAFSVLLLVTALCHAFAAAVTGMVCGLWIMGSFRARHVLKGLSALALASLPALCVLFMVALTAGEHQHESIVSLLEFRTSSLLWLPRNLYDTTDGPIWAANITIGLAVLAMIWSVFRRDRRARGPFCAVVVCVVAIAVLPDVVEAWDLLHPRFTPFIAVLACGAAGLRLPTSRSFRVGASALVMGLTIVSLVTITTANYKLAEIMSEYEAGIGAVEDAGPRRFVFRPQWADARFPGQHMGANLHSYYMIDEGAVFPYLFMGRPEKHFIHSTDRWSELEPPFPLPREGLPREILLEIQARYGLYFDEIMLWAPQPGDIETFQAIGYDVEFAQERLVRLRPPRRFLHLEIAGESTTPLLAVVTFGNITSPYRSGAVKLVQTGTPQHLVWFGRMPAGVVGIEVFAWQGPDIAPLSVAERTVDLSASSQTIVIELSD